MRTETKNHLCQAERSMVNLRPEFDTFQDGLSGSLGDILSRERFESLERIGQREMGRRMRVW